MQICTIHFPLNLYKKTGFCCFCLVTFAYAGIHDKAHHGPCTSKVKHCGLTHGQVSSTAALEMECLCVPLLWISQLCRYKIQF